MQRPLTSPPKNKIYYNRICQLNCPVGFSIGLCISITIFIAYYSRFINFIEPCSSII